MVEIIGCGEIDTDDHLLQLACGYGQIIVPEDDDLLVTWIALSAALLLTGEVKSQTVAKSPKNQPESTPTVLDKEARAFLSHYWDKLLRKCPDGRDDSYFYYGSEHFRLIDGKIMLTADGNGNSERPLNADYCCRALVEMKGVTFAYSGTSNLSEAARMNGVAYNGGSSISVRIYRERWQRAGIKWDSWGEWKNKSDGFYFAVPNTITFEKKNGQWILYGLSLYSPPADELPEMPGCAGFQASVPEPTNWPLTALPPKLKLVTHQNRNDPKTLSAETLKCSTKPFCISGKRARR